MSHPPKKGTSRKDGASSGDWFRLRARSVTVNGDDFQGMHETSLFDDSWNARKSASTITPPACRSAIANNRLWIKRALPYRRSTFEKNAWSIEDWAAPYELQSLTALATKPSHIFRRRKRRP